MPWNLTPLAFAISASFFVGTNAWAAGGESGPHGDIITPSNQISSAAPGTVGSDANGTDGANFTSALTYTLSQGYIGVSVGQSGSQASSGGGGIGGVGGGSVFGAISYGGAGGNDIKTINSAASANGGNGGAIRGKSILYSGGPLFTLTGVAGGSGGISPANMGAGAGAGGVGGGSIIGALSQGGSGGYASSEGFTNTATGGDGGDLSEITLNLSGINLNGAPGGGGGRVANVASTSAAGGGGNGAPGGGSVFAAFSQGGAGGSSKIATSSLNYLSPEVTSTNGGASGAISNISLTLVNAELKGAIGGAGGWAAAYPDNLVPFVADGAGGSGGAGGGSVFAVFSQAGAGGGNDLVSGGASKTSADGGAAGSISDIALTLVNTKLFGANGGDGGQAGAGVGATGSGGSGVGGAGGGSVFAVYSQGGIGGQSAASASSNGGAGASIKGVTLRIENAELNGALGGQGGQAALGLNQLSRVGFGHGGAGAGGVGGGSIFAAFSRGGAAGAATQKNSRLVLETSAYASGGVGGDIADVTLELSDLMLVGAEAGLGGQVGNIVDPAITNLYGTRYGAGGAGGAGGGSIFAAFSQGGAGGMAYSGMLPQVADGGTGGSISDVSLFLNKALLKGALGGGGGQSTYGMSDTGGMSFGAGGSGGVGGGTILGAFSQGGDGGITSGNGYYESHRFTASGGDGGVASRTSLVIRDVELNGVLGGAGGRAGYNNQASEPSFGGGGAGGAGGGSIIAGFSQGGAGGATNIAFYMSVPARPNIVITYEVLANGGNGGDVKQSYLDLLNVRLLGGAGGAGGEGGNVNASNRGGGGAGARGINGGSIFGGYSAGGAGGASSVSGFSLADIAGFTVTADGGDGGNAGGNTIRLAGMSTLTGDVYGGYTQGGNAGTVILGGTITNPSAQYLGANGRGGEAVNNTITLVGTKLAIGGSVYGGFSIDGDVDFTAVGYAGLNNSRTFSGNTLNLEGYRGSVEGLYNFENYNWMLPVDVVKRDIIIDIRSNDLVDLNNTQHTVADLLSNGNRLNENDEIVLISKAQGKFQPTKLEVKQGPFIIYDAALDINDSDEFVLRIAGKEDATPVITPTPKASPTPGGRLNPTSKAFLEGRAAALAMVNQGADMIRNELSVCETGVFLDGEGGRSQYKTGSRVKVNEFRLLFGGRTCLDLPDASQMVLSLFAEDGNGNYKSRNHFDAIGNIEGHGDLRYTGAGLAMHLDIAGTGNDVKTIAVLGRPSGLYLDAALRVGSVKSDFSSNNLVDVLGNRFEYSAKSTYGSASAGVGYILNLDIQRQVDLYGRYAWSRIGSDEAKVGADVLQLGADTSSRLLIGGRYGYALSEQVTSYAGVAYEYDFDGRISGKAYDMSIEKPTLKGGTSMLEVGITAVPISAASGFKIDLGVQSFAGLRKGTSGSLSLVYDF